MTEVTFVGQQEGERVLYEVVSHPLRHWVRVGRVVFLAVLIVVLFGIVSSAASWLLWLGLVVGAGFGVIGWWGVLVMEAKSKSYVTDRRVVRFTATTPWTVNNRTLSWDEVVKVKTKSAGVWWRMLGAGGVAIHARSTVVPGDIEKTKQFATSDDVELDYVIYYQDLGNYLDKVLYLFKNNKTELAEIRPFVAKPKGKRY